MHDGDFAKPWCSYLCSDQPVITPSDGYNGMYAIVIYRIIAAIYTGEQPLMLVFSKIRSRTEMLEECDAMLSETLILKTTKLR